MNKSIRAAQQILYTAITQTASKSAQRKLANAAYHLGERLWEEPSSPA